MPTCAGHFLVAAGRVASLLMNPLCHAVEPYRTLNPQAYNNANYHEAVSQTFAAVVKRIGTGPASQGATAG